MTESVARVAQELGRAPEVAYDYPTCWELAVKVAAIPDIATPDREVIRGLMNVLQKVSSVHFLTKILKFFEYL